MSKPKKRERPTDLEILASMAEWAKKARENYFMEPLADALDDGVDLVKRLCGEVERWKPRAMTLQEAAKVMRDHAFDGVSDWAVTKDVEAGRMVYSGWRSFHSEKHAVYIAQGLLRDAAASAGEGEDARGGRVL